MDITKKFMEWHEKNWKKLFFILIGLLIINSLIIMFAPKEDKSSWVEPFDDSSWSTEPKVTTVGDMFKTLPNWVWIAIFVLPIAIVIGNTWRRF